jgi:hypothetical protein
LGAYDVTILNKDRQLLEDDKAHHFPEDCNNKLKVLGPSGAVVYTLKKIKELLGKSDDEMEQELSVDLSFESLICPVYSVLEKDKQSYFENLLTTLVKKNFPSSL